ncbi:MAG: GNAT family N-acetyltransferase [Myxococcaceae bacterium]|jgi:GNAT superfamily N-acetyltransferase|nr:GNAT family N-acetyltransferase [Myxococcaceae bacterium]MCA3016359.1 GNAT family N-acetyltransferase [Myxococcaceae bacterium]
MLRSARDDDADYEAFTRLFPLLRVDDAAPSRARFGAELAPTTVVVEMGGDVVAYAWFQAFADEGIVRHLVVSPSAQGRGVGRALLSEVARRLRVQGLSRWALNVKPDNLPALALYRRLGFVEAYRSVSLRFGWPLVDGLPARPAVSVGPVQPGDDARVEAAVRVPRGTLATHRALPGRLLCGAWEGGRVVGAAVFLPAFPGAYPFRAGDLEVARALLDGVRPAATSPVMNVVVEGQPTLADALVGHGAVVTLELVHLEGALPG